MDPLVISGKVLGQLALPEYCQRCFWIHLRCRRLPYQRFPGIFSSIDSLSKNYVEGFYERHRKLPGWLSTLDGARPIQVPHHSHFRTRDVHSNVVLSGAPDGMLQEPDDSLVIIDFKTARHTKIQDALFPLYEVQLNSYAWIAERLNIGNAVGLSLIYCEPLTDVERDSIDSIGLPDGFAMHFRSTVVPVPLHLDRIPPLLAQVRELNDQELPPSGRAGCKECHLLDQLFQVASAVR